MNDTSTIVDEQASSRASDEGAVVPLFGELDTREVSTRSAEPIRNPRAYGASILRSVCDKVKNARAAERAVSVLGERCPELVQLIERGYVRRSRVEEELQVACEAAGLAAGNARLLITTVLVDAMEPVDPPLPTFGADDPIVLRSSKPLVLAESFLESCIDDEGRVTVRRWRGAWFEFSGGAYREVSDERIEARMWRHFGRCHVLTPEGPRELGPTTAKIRDAMRALASLTGVMLEDAGDPPFFVIDGRALARNRAVFVNGLLDLTTTEIAPSTPDLFATSTIATPWTPDAPRPVRWYRFLEDLFGDDWQAVDLLGEWFGYCLASDTSQQKLLFIIGPRRSGKGTIARVLTALLGRSSVAAPTLAFLAGPFGLASLLGRSVAIVPDARFSGGPGESAIVERLLSITGEDSIEVDIKNVKAVTARIGARLMILTNEIPRLADASNALASRMLVLQLRNSFLGAEDLNLEAELVEELPGILRWAVEGWQRLQEHGRFRQPASGREAIAELASASSPITLFAEEALVFDEPGVDPPSYVGAVELFAEWSRWCAMNGHRPGSTSTLSRSLGAAFGDRVLIGYRPRSAAQKRCFGRLRLRDEWLTRRDDDRDRFEAAQAKRDERLVRRLRAAVEPGSLEHGRDGE